MSDSEVWLQNKNSQPMFPQVPEASASASRAPDLHAYGYQEVKGVTVSRAVERVPPNSVHGLPEPQVLGSLLNKNYFRWRLKLEGETENMGVCTKERKGLTADGLMATQ